MLCAGGAQNSRADFGESVRGPDGLVGQKVLGGGLEPPCLAAYAPQTYVSAISPPERVSKHIRANRRRKFFALFASR